MPAEAENPYAPPRSDVEEPARAPGRARLAKRGARLLAAMLDGLVMAVVFLPLQWFTGYYDRVTDSMIPTPEDMLWYVIGFVGWVGMNWAFLQQGQTIGKRALGLRIVARGGGPVSAQHIVLKRMLPVTLVSWIPVVGAPIALIDALLIFRAERNTLHDDIASTKVVEA